MALDLPVDLLEDIFLRLGDAADLIRASAVCTSFRRVVSDDRFLRRLRSLCRPPVLGFLDCRDDRDDLCSFHAAQPPRFTASAAATFAEAADFAFSFLADDVCRVRDVRDGRVLFSRSYIYEDFLVYDPLHRRHVEIPGIDDFATRFEGLYGFEPFFDPATEKEKEDLSFRVICNLYSGPEEKIRTFVFSSTIGKWRAETPFPIKTSWLDHTETLRRHYAHGCFFWTKFDERVMLMLETREMKFSIVDLPGEIYDRGNTAVVEAVEGRIGLLRLGGSMLEVYIKTCPDNGIRVEDWRHDNAIPLHYGYHWSLGAVAEGNLLLRGVRLDRYYNLRKAENKKPDDAQYFTLKLDTLLVEWLCESNLDTRPCFLYTSFPPSLSLPSLSNSLESQHHYPGRYFLTSQGDRAAYVGKTV